MEEIILTKKQKIALYNKQYRLENKEQIALNL
jgi:hypothetical protein